MFTQPLLPFFWQGRRLFGVKIVVDQHGAALDAEPPLLPSLVVHGKGLGSNPADPCPNLYLILEVQLPHIVIIRMGDNEREGFAPEFQRRIKYFKQRIPRKFKPNYGNGVVNVPQYIHVSKTGVYGCYEHNKSIAKMYELNQYTAISACFNHV